jgi:branched-chain amino acid transport system substrate-binding protein
MMGIAIAKHSPSTTMIINVWGFDDVLYPTCGVPCADRAYGIAPFATYGDTRYEGMKKLVALNEKYRAADGENPVTSGTLNYVKGHVMLLPWIAALKKAAATGQITRQSIISAMDALSGTDTGGVTAPLTFSASDHRPTMGAYVYRINQFGKFEYETKITLDRRPEWLGW